MKIKNPIPPAGKQKPPRHYRHPSGWRNGYAEADALWLEAVKPLVGAGRDALDALRACQSPMAEVLVAALAPFVEDDDA